MKSNKIKILVYVLLVLTQSNLYSNSNLGMRNTKVLEDHELANIEYQDTARYLLGKKLWEGDIENGVLGLPWPDPSYSQRNIFEKPSENSGPGGRYSDIVSESPAFGRTGKKAIKMRLDLTPTSEGGTGTKAGIRHFNDSLINNYSDIIFTSWFYIPQLITRHGHGVMLMQWKQNTSRWMGSWWYSHANVGISLFNRNGQNFVRVGVLDVFWRSGGGVKWQQHPSKNIPINQWFGIKARYVKSDPGVPNGRFTVWQIDLDGTHHLIADHKNVITYWDKDEKNYSGTNFSGELLRAGIAWYAENAQPYVLTSYADDPSLYLPLDQSNVETSYTLSLQANPNAGGSVQNLTGGNTFKQGQKIQVRASPSQGYKFVNWTLDGAVVSTQLEFEYTMSNKNATLIANFQVESTSTTRSLQLGASPSQGGKVTIKSGN